MKLSDKIATYSPTQPFYTFEFFPPRTDQVGSCVNLYPLLLKSMQGFDNLISRISRLSALHPIAISVTWGAGGSTRDRSLDLAGLTQSEYGIDTVLHLTCTNMLPGMVDDALRVRQWSSRFQYLTKSPGSESAGYTEHPSTARWLVSHPRHAMYLMSYPLHADPPRGQEHWTPIDSRFTSGLDLVKYIRSSEEYSSHFCIGVAGN